MKKSFLFVWCITVVITLLILAGCSREPQHLTLGLVPSNNPEAMRKNFEPIRVYLEKEMRYTIEVAVPKDYVGLVEAMKSKKVDVGWFGAFSYIAAASEIPLEPMVIQYRTGFGTSYHSLMVTRKDSGIQNIQQLQGRTFAFVDKGSTSGFVIPYSLFKSRNIDYNSFLKEISFAGSHDAVLTAVMNKQTDAGAMEDITFKRWIEEGKVKEEDVRIIWQSNDIPGSPFVSRADLPPKTKQKFIEAMTVLHEKNPQAMKAFDGKIEKYVQFNDSLYNEIRNISNILGKTFIFDNFLKEK